MRPHIILISAVLFLLTIGLVLFLAATYAPPAGTLPAPGEMVQEPMEGNPYSGFFVPEFTLTDRHGETLTHSVLDGEYTVVDFFYTSCPLYCPTMTTNMVRVQNETVGTGARFLSVSIDGELDTPEVIDRFAKAYNTDPKRWVFATGEPDYVAGLVETGLRFEIGEVSPTPQTGGREINHPTRLILIGPDRHVIGLYRYDDPDEIDALIAKIKQITG